LCRWSVTALSHHGIARFGGSRDARLTICDSTSQHGERVTPCDNERNSHSAGKCYSRSPNAAVVLCALRQARSTRAFVPEPCSRYACGSVLRMRYVEASAAIGTNAAQW